MWVGRRLLCLLACIQFARATETLEEIKARMKGPLPKVWDEINTHTETDQSLQEQMNQLQEKLSRMAACFQPPLVYGTDNSITVDNSGLVTAHYSCKSGLIQLRGSVSTATCNAGVWNNHVDLKCTDYSDCYIVEYGRALYKGHVAKTKYGHDCQRWDTEDFHSHGQTDDRFYNTGETLTSAADYCRDPDGEMGPWCYTTDYDWRWDYCSVPQC